MASIKDQEKLNVAANLAEKAVNKASKITSQHIDAFQRSLDYQHEMTNREPLFTDEMLDNLRDHSTPESSRLDILIDLMADMNDRIDSQHQEQVEHQQKVEAWHEEDSKSSKFSNRIGIATLIATIAGIFVGGAITIGVQLLTG